MIYYKCNKCGKEWESEVDNIRCPSCSEKEIEYDSEKSTKEFICHTCQIIYEFPFDECKGWWNYKCEKCYNMAQDKKDIYINFNNIVSKTKIGQYTKFKPDMNYLEKTYGDELHKPYDTFTKKKK
jgi:hypothetical protein